MAGAGLGTALFVAAFLPSLVYIFISQDFGILTSYTFIIFTVAGLAIGVAGSIALNGSGVVIIFTITMGSAIYLALILSTYGLMGFPYEAELDAFTTFLLILGLFIMASGGTNK